MKIPQAYGLANEFSNTMDSLETNSIQYTDVHESKLGRKYLAIDRMTSNFMKNHRVSMIIGTLLFTLFNPKKMIKAQKYYSSGFGKPCPIRKK